ncbi:hypothetical protein GMLC_08550 [Geomonas limicola]|uniref:Cobalt ABC transporter permease n=1 Tax=Geomonas limicola TaxID=2740186 RepID=A0A6V8N441_9BACT|nr:hypothetical protein GMLC_08550 [Geomonas limicola]
MVKNCAWKMVLVHLVTLPTFYFAVGHLNLAPKSWNGVDEAVVEKIAKEHGRQAVSPVIDPGSGDLLLFAFLVAGALGGFAAGYYWRELVKKKA